MSEANCVARLVATLSILSEVAFNATEFEELH